MSQDVTVIDLGELNGSRRPDPRAGAAAHLGELNASRRSGRRAMAATDHFTFTAPRATSQAARGLRPTARVAASLSIFIPGAGQLLAGEVTSGLFFLSSMGFLAALGWAIVVSYDRILGTLGLFGLPAIIPFCAVVFVYLMAAIIHISCTLHAHALGFDSSEARGIHPVWAGFASLLVPGWGQMLNGCTGRGALFLASLWTFGAGWLLVTAPVQRMLGSLGLHVPLPTNAAWAALILFTVPAIVWAVAICDAASRAAADRRA